MDIEDDKDENKRSRFRGVYRCGPRWKAQLQRQGKQYYLGIYDTEIEAAHAYDAKAREDESGTMLTNFNEDGTETFISSTSTTVKKPANKYAPSSMSISMRNGNASTTDTKRKKRQKTENSELLSTEQYACKNFSFIMRLENPGHVRLIWERYSSITERLLIGKAANDRLLELQRTSPDEEKTTLIISLAKEITKLGLAKIHLEESFERAVGKGLANAAATATTAATTVFRGELES